MEKIFDLPQIGALMLEHVFYMYEEPILFVCKDSSGTRFLCSCCRLSEEWVIAKVDEKVLIQLIDDEITIREAFESQGESTYLITWDGENYGIECNAPDDMLPKVGAKLELGYERDGAYKSTLQAAYEQKFFFQSIMQVNLDMSESIKLVAPIIKETQQKISAFFKECGDLFQPYQELLSFTVTIQTTLRRTSEMSTTCNSITTDISSEERSVTVKKVPKHNIESHGWTALDIDTTNLAA